MILCIKQPSTRGQSSLVFSFSDGHSRHFLVSLFSSLLSGHFCFSSSLVITLSSPPLLPSSSPLKSPRTITFKLQRPSPPPSQACLCPECATPTSGASRPTQRASMPFTIRSLAAMRRPTPSTSLHVVNSMVVKVKVRRFYHLTQDVLQLTRS